MPDEDLRRAGLSGAKLASLRDLSAKVLDGTVVLGASSRIPDEEVIARLVTDPNVDQLMLKRLKKRKLMLKDMITQLESARIPTRRSRSTLSRSTS